MLGRAELDQPGKACWLTRIHLLPFVTCESGITASQLCCPATTRAHGTSGELDAGGGQVRWFRVHFIATFQTRAHCTSC